MIHTEARGWRLPTWDHQLIPWPFAQVTLHFKRNEEPLTALRLSGVADRRKLSVAMNAAFPIGQRGWSVEASHYNLSIA